MPPTDPVETVAAPLVAGGELDPPPLVLVTLLLLPQATKPRRPTTEMSPIVLTLPFHIDLIDPPRGFLTRTNDLDARSSPSRLSLSGVRTGADPGWLDRR